MEKIYDHIQLLDKLEDILFKKVGYTKIKYNSNCLKLEKFEYLISLEDREKLVKVIKTFFNKNYKWNIDRMDKEERTINQIINKTFKDSTLEDAIKQKALNCLLK